METLLTVAQIVIALGIFNVWILRIGQDTAWRGGNARNMKEEFQAYGLPLWVMAVTGFLKVLLAGFLLAGVWVPAFTRPAALGLAVLMLGAVAMHVKISDPIKKSLPAASILVLCLLIGVL